MRYNKSVPAVVIGQAGDATTMSRILLGQEGECVSMKINKRLRSFMAMLLAAALLLGLVACTKEGKPQIVSTQAEMTDDTKSLYDFPVDPITGFPYKFTTFHVEELPDGSKEHWFVLIVGTEQMLDHIYLEFFDLISNRNLSQFTYEKDGIDVPYYAGKICKETEENHYVDSKVLDRYDQVEFMSHDYAEFIGYVHTAPGIEFNGKNLAVQLSGERSGEKGEWITYNPQMLEQNCDISDIPVHPKVVHSATLIEHAGHYYVFRSHSYEEIRNDREGYWAAEKRIHFDGVDATMGPSKNLDGTVHPSLQDDLPKGAEAGYPVAGENSRFGPDHLMPIQIDKSVEIITGGFDNQDGAYLPEYYSFRYLYYDTDPNAVHRKETFDAISHCCMVMNLSYGPVLFYLNGTNGSETPTSP